MKDRELTRLLILCGSVELIAWAIAWLTNWSVGALVAAVAISMGVGGVIVLATQRQKRDRGNGP